MSILVGNEGVEPAAVHRLVYRQMPANVFGHEYPLLGMDLLIPVLVVAQVILVHLAKIVTVDTVSSSNLTMSNWSRMFSGSINDTTPYSKFLSVSVIPL